MLIVVVQAECQRNESQKKISYKGDIQIEVTLNEDVIVKRCMVMGQHELLA